MFAKVVFGEFRAMREYTHALRLVSKLPDLRAGYAHSCACSLFVLKAKSVRFARASFDDGPVGEFRLRRIFFALPLTSKLDALCGENAHSCICVCANALSIRAANRQKEKSHPT